MSGILMIKSFLLVAERLFFRLLKCKCLPENEPKIGHAYQEMVMKNEECMFWCG
jgi:hypothetical protein